MYLEYPEHASHMCCVILMRCYLTHPTMHRAPIQIVHIDYNSAIVMSYHP